MNKVLTALVLMAVFAPWHVQAQEKLQTLPEVLALVQDTEVYLQGYIGRGPEGAVRFVLADARNNGFPADFESEKDLDTAIKGCGFDGSGGLPCKFTAYAHLNWEGARLHVVVTRIESIEPPAAWQ